MQLLILCSKQPFTQMTHYYTPIRNVTDRYAQVSCRVYHSVCWGSCAKQFNIPHSYQSPARSKGSDCRMFTGAPAHTKALKEMCLTLPSNQTVLSLTLPTCPNKEVTYQRKSLCWIKHPAQKGRPEKPLTQIGSLTLYILRLF